VCTQVADAQRRPAERRYVSRVIGAERQLNAAGERVTAGMSFKHTLMSKEDKSTLSYSTLACYEKSMWLSGRTFENPLRKTERYDF
jgi:hypothetical protein